MRSRWMPAWIDAVEYGKFGRATVTATLFGGMDPRSTPISKRHPALMNGVENTLKHTEGGTAGPTQMAARGKLLDVTKLPGEAPLGSSGIQIRFETDLITEGMRPTRIVKVRPQAGPMSTCRARNISGRSLQHRRALPDPGHLSEILIHLMKPFFVLRSLFFVPRAWR
jgi:hypothetical protein